MTREQHIIAKLSKGWQRADDLCKEMSWKSHTLRGLLSRMGQTHSVERKRENGVTSYRIVPPDMKAASAKATSEDDIPECLRRPVA